MSEMKRLTNPEDLEKLPVWARDQIKVLLTSKAQLEAKLSAGPENSDTFADPYISETVRPLGKGTRIRFGGAGYDMTFDVHYTEGRLVVQANGNQHLAVVPQSSNHAFLTFMER